MKGDTVLFLSNLSLHGVSKTLNHPKLHCIWQSPLTHLMNRGGRDVSSGGWLWVWLKLIGAGSDRYRTRMTRIITDFYGLTTENE